MLRRTAFRIVRPGRNPTRSRRTGNGCREPGGTQRIRHKKRGAPQYAPPPLLINGQAIDKPIEVEGKFILMMV